MGRVLSAISTLSSLLVVVLLGYYIGWIRIPVFEKKLSELEAECIVAAIHSDARWAGDVDLAVRREIGATMLRHAKIYRRDVCDVFRLGLTLVPNGYQRFSGMYFRSEAYIRKSLESTEASWKSDLQLVSELLKEKDAGCATHYIRKDRTSDWMAQSEKARSAIRLTMQSVGHAKANGKDVGGAEFFCAKL